MIPGRSFSAGSRESQPDSASKSNVSVTATFAFFGHGVGIRISS
jgi:hypothetical protein